MLVPVGIAYGVASGVPYSPLISVLGPDSSLAAVILALVALSGGDPLRAVAVASSSAERVWIDESNTV